MLILLGLPHNDGEFLLTEARAIRHAKRCGCVSCIRNLAATDRDYVDLCERLLARQTTVGLQAILYDWSREQIMMALDRYERTV